MVETAIPLTLHLAVLIGVYELTAGLVSLSGRMDWTAMMDEFERSPALTFITGFLAFAIGGTIVLAHNHWTDPLAVIVSLIGWIAAAEGVLVMALGKALLLPFHRVVRYPRAIGAAASLFGVALILAGLTGRATALTYI